ncbi:unnamed protein product [Cunninghamella blakesleeana]
MDNKDTYQYFVEDDQSFSQHISNMEQDGCFGGNMELAAFAKLKRVNIKVYQPGMIYIVNGIESDENENDSDDENTDGTRRTLHIAYHSWEHYSSIRNIDGPFNGLPEIKEQILNLDPQASINDDDDDDDNTKEPDSKEKVVLIACPDTDIRKIRRLLRKHKGDTDKVIDKIYESYENDTNNVELLEEVTKSIEIETTELDKNNEFIKYKDDTNNNDGVNNIKKDKMENSNDMEKNNINNNINSSNDGVDDDINDAKNVNIEKEKHTKQSTMDNNNSLKTNDDTNEQQEQQEKHKPKKMSNRDKKYQKKLQQKKQQLEKKQQQAKARLKDNKNTGVSSANKSDTNESLTMKQLYI